MSARLGLRLSSELRAAVDGCGERSSAARALLLLGLASCNRLGDALLPDLAVLAHDTSLDPQLRAGVLLLLRGVRQHHTTDGLNELLNNELNETLNTAPADLFGGVGFEV